MNHRYTIFHAGRRALFALTLTLCATFASGDFNTFEVLEGAAEVDRLTLKSTSSQILYTRECDECPMLALSVTAQTQYFKGGTPITLSRAIALGSGATVFFDKGERTVSRIVFWQ